MLKVTSGADAQFDATIRNADETPVNLTGFAPGIIDASQLIAGRLTATITNAAAGQFRITLEGTDPLPAGNYRFRVQMTGSGMQSIATPRLTIEVA